MDNNKEDQNLELQVIEIDINTDKCEYKNEINNNNTNKQSINTEQSINTVNKTKLKKCSVCLSNAFYLLLFLLIFGLPIFLIILMFLSW